MRKKATVELGSVIQINPAAISKNYPYGEIEYIDISSVGTGFYSGSKPMLLAEAPSRAKRLVEDGDTIIATVRPNLRSFLYIKNPPQNLVVSTGFAVLRPTDKINSRFLYYSVTNQRFTDYLSANVKGAAYPAVDTETFERAIIWFPDLGIQNKIAAILSAYDDLIENNLRRIKILEEMAQTLYREWFVKFRFPGHQKVKMVDSPLGKIPEGWEIKKLEEVCSYIVRGVTPKYLQGSRRFIINQKSNRGSSIKREELKELTPDLEVPKEKMARKGDLLVNSLGEGTIGRVHYFQGPENQWAVDQHMTICRSTTPGVTLYFYLKLSNEEGQGWIHSVKTGATNMTMLNISTLRAFESVFPPFEILSHFFDICQPVFDQRFLLEEKNILLCQTRDLLLPKLISGDLDVSELDIKVLEANS